LFNWQSEYATQPSAWSLEINGSNGDQGLKIAFVMPDPQPEPAIDVSPPSPYEGAVPNPSLPQLEKPRPRIRTATGALFETPRSTDWLK
jgi:hypothetical protein